MKNLHINCFKCKYFYITWDSKFPKGCKFFGFKSKSVPSVSVYQATGNECEMFIPK